PGENSTGKKDAATQTLSGDGPTSRTQTITSAKPVTKKSLSPSEPSPTLARKSLRPLEERPKVVTAPNQPYVDKKGTLRTINVTAKNLIAAIDANNSDEIKRLTDKATDEERE